MLAHEGLKPAKRKRWTVMLYMAASKDEQTERAAVRDLTELEKVGTTDDSKLNVLVQIDRKWPGYAERYCIRGENKSDICDVMKDQKNDSGDPEVLRAFVRWGRTMFPADSYLLVLWGHNYGLGFGRDHGDALTLRELAAALNRQELGIPIPKGRRAVDILGANACAMSYAEAAYELRDAADFLVAPEIAMPFAGWPYERILNGIIEKPHIAPKDLGEAIVEHFMASFEQAVEPQSVALTLLNLREAGNIKAPLTKLTGALKAAIRRSGVREHIADAFLETAHGEVRPLIDLFDLCAKLAKIDAASATKVTHAAEGLGAFLERANGFVVKHTAGRELEGLHGVGIFAPSVTGTADLMRLELSRREYRSLSLAKDTKWTTLAYEGLRNLLDPLNKAVADFVNGTGATSFEERAGVAPLLVGIHQSFVKLDKTVAETQAKVMNVLNGNLNGNGGVKGPRLLSQEHSSVGPLFGPPFLRLAANLPSPQHAEVSVVSEEAFSPGRPVGKIGENQSDPGPLQSVAESLAKLEDALANVERTAKRVMTHASLGLGADPIGKPGLGADPIGKPGLGADPIGKPGLGADPIGKPGLGADPIGKPGLGLLPWLVPANRGYVSSPGDATSVVELYGQVAWSLQLIEEAVARLENVLQPVMTGPADGLRADAVYRQRVTEQVRSSFRELTEVTTNAKQIALQVLAHPAYGVGPSPQSELGGGAGRQQLAVMGGLSPRLLRLL